MPYQAARSISLPCDAGQDLPQRRFCGHSATGLVLGPDQGASTAGVSLETYDDSEFALDGASNVIPVALLDGAVLEVEASAEAITVGAAITADAAGQAKLANAAGDVVLGYALNATAAAGEIVTFQSQSPARTI